jgi:hypothetical protein
MIIFFNVEQNRVVCNDDDFFQAIGIARFDGLNVFSYLS